MCGWGLGRAGRSASVSPPQFVRKDRAAEWGGELLGRWQEGRRRAVGAARRGTGPGLGLRF